MPNQFRSRKFVKALKDADLVGSMGRVAIKTRNRGPGIGSGSGDRCLSEGVQQVNVDGGGRGDLAHLAPLVHHMGLVR